MTATLERTDEELIAAALPPDPLAAVKVGDEVTVEQMSTYLDDDGAQRTSRGRDICFQPYMDGGYCQRAQHPEHWDHIYPADEQRSGIVQAKWSTYAGEGFPELPAQVDDSGEEVNVNEISGLMRFRNRRDLLLVIGPTEEGSKNYDVLDLTHQRFRRINEEKLVPRRPADPEPTADEMAWAAQWLAKSKKSVLQVARREVRSRRWDVPTMTKSLAKMDIVPPPPTWSGTVNLTISFDLAKAGEGVTPSRMELRAMLRKLFDGPGNEDIKNVRVSTTETPAWTQS